MGYTERQERALGLTPRARVGPAWVDASTLTWGELDSNDYNRADKQHLGVRSQEALARMMEEEQTNYSDKPKQGNWSVDPIQFPRRAAELMRSELAEGNNHNLEVLLNELDRNPATAYLLRNGG